MHDETPVTRSSNRVLMGLGLTAALVLVACLGLGAAAFLVAHDPVVKGAVASRSHRTGAVLEAMSAPGTKELKAIGCAQALVFDGHDMDDLVGDLVDGGRPGDLERVKVVCRGELSLALPPCDLVAKTWAQAANPTVPFLVSSVNPTGRCVGRYDASGQREP